MLYNKKGIIAIVALAVFSLAIHFIWFGHPNMTVFDEVHFGKFFSAYFTHEYYFDIHPPLGKLISAGWGWLWGFQPGFSFANIGDVFPDRMYMALRFLPTLAGVLLPLVIYGIARKLGLSRVAALFAGTFIALDNALIAQSRLILLDPFLLLFGFSAIWCYFHFLEKLKTTSYKLSTLWLAGGGILGAMAMSIKWTGATFLALIIVLEAVRLWQVRKSGVSRNLWSLVVSLIVVPFIVYYSIFIVHFALLTKSGAGDAFMSPEFQHDLIGNSYTTDDSLKSPSLFHKFIELNLQMYQSNQRLTATHPYSSAWYTWPLLERPIFYWVNETSRIYLLGNPIVWWASTVGILIVLINILLSGLRRLDRTILFLAGAWAINILPFIGIGRVMFLYHYFTALIWAILMLAYLVDKAKHPRRAVAILTTLALASFIFFAPLTYGLPMSDHAYGLRTWFSSWR